MNYILSHWLKLTFPLIYTFNTSLSWPFLAFTELYVVTSLLQIKDLSLEWLRILLCFIIKINTVSHGMFSVVLYCELVIYCISWCWILVIQRNERMRLWQELKGNNFLEKSKLRSALDGIWKIGQWS